MKNTTKALILSAVFIASSSHKVDAVSWLELFSKATTKRAPRSPRLAEVRTEQQGKKTITWEKFSTGSIRRMTFSPECTSYQETHRDGTVSTHATNTTSFLEQLRGTKNSTVKQQIREESTGSSAPLRRWKLHSLTLSFLKNLELGKPSTLTLDLREFDDTLTSSMSSTVTSREGSGLWDQEEYLANVWGRGPTNALEQRLNALENEKSRREEIRRGKQKVTHSENEDSDNEAKEN